MNIQPIKYLLHQVRRVSTLEDQSISEVMDYQYHYYQILYLIRNMYDIKNKQQCHSLIAQGIVGVLLEIILKIDLINEECRLEAFRLYRLLFQYEWELRDNELRSEEQLETQKLIKIFPKSIHDLFLDDEDESQIFNNFSREWFTPNLIWSEWMIKETLLILIEYNNSYLKSVNSYEQTISINQPIFPENRNETYIQNIILKEYNKQPSWALEEGLLAFLEEGIDCINQSLKLYLLGHSDDSAQSLKAFDRLSCKLLTQFTSFQLALEQYFFNFTHTEFEQELSLLQDYDQEQIQDFLNKQRDAIPLTIIKEISIWMELVNSHHQRIHIYVKSLLLQVFYILTYSEVAMVILEQQDLINKMLILNQNVLKGQFHKYDKILALNLLSQIFQYPFIVSKLEYKHYVKLYDIYTLIKDDEDIKNIYKNVIALIYNDHNQVTEFSRFLLDSNFPLKTQDLSILQNNQFLKVSLWRTAFDDLTYEMLYYEQLKAESDIRYPIISQISIEPLPHMADILKNRMNSIKTLYEEYVTQLRNGKIPEVSTCLINEDTQTEQISIRQSIKSNDMEIGEDEVYS